MSSIGTAVGVGIAIPFQISPLFGYANLWILRHGVWDDTGIWIDTEFWKDSP